MNMFTKEKAKQFARQYGWTGADAERAFANLDLKSATEENLVIALVTFAGPELKTRQSERASQKGLVTKKRKELEKVERDLENHLQESRQKINEMRSLFMPVIQRIYQFAKPLGFRDPWIEAMLEAYKEYLDRQEDDPDSPPSAA